jgi:molybdenum cofactor cytidylyltransferase
MGAFKPLLPFGDSTVVDSCVANLRDGGVETLVVVTGHNREQLQQHLSGSAVVLATNPDPGGEMSSSIACGVREVASQSGALVITPVDYPAVPAEVVSLLISAWKWGAMLVKPTWQGRGGHPVLIDMSFRDELLNLDPTKGLKGFFDAHMDQVTRLPVNSNYIARDLDTWDDYAALHKDVFGS